LNHFRPVFVEFLCVQMGVGIDKLHGFSFSAAKVGI